MCLRDIGYVRQHDHLITNKDLQDTRLQPVDQKVEK